MGTFARVAGAVLLAALLLCSSVHGYALDGVHGGASRLQVAQKVPRARPQPPGLARRPRRRAPSPPLMRMGNKLPPGAPQQPLVRRPPLPPAPPAALLEQLGGTQADSLLSPFARYSSRQEMKDAFKLALGIAPEELLAELKAASAAQRAQKGVRPAGVAGVTVLPLNPETEASVWQFWGHWKSHFRRKFSTSRAEQNAYTVFRSRVIRIASSLTELGRPNWSKFGQNLVGDVTGPDYYAPNVTAGPPEDAAELVWDWRVQGKVTPAKQQGRECHACWAFAAAAAIESKLLIQMGTTFSNNPVDLSEQLLINCVSAELGFESQGCINGSLVEPFLFASASGGGYITTESAEPYVGATGQCLAPDAPQGSGDRLVLEGDGFVELLPWSAAALRAAVRKQPVVVGFYATELFALYSGGVVAASECNFTSENGQPDHSTTPLNHALLVVGWNRTANPPYWIVKNSWGSGADFGDNGFALIEMTGENTTGTCGMYAWMVHPTDIVNNTLPNMDPGSVRFSAPLYNNLPVDVCSEFGGPGCGHPAAQAWCRSQGFEAVVEVGPYLPSPTGETSFPDKVYVCTGGPGCLTFDYLVCGLQKSGVKFSAPSYYGVPIDVCRDYKGIGCGAPAATDWCALQGMKAVVEIGPSVPPPLGETAYPKFAYTCTRGASCTTFEYVACGFEELGQPVKFVAPKHQGIPLDACPQLPGANCGTRAAASVWCRVQGMSVAAEVGSSVRSLAGTASYPGRSWLCTSDCSTPAYVVCNPALPAPPPPPLAAFGARFPSPTVHNASLDWCWGLGPDWNATECGSHVAMRWCALQGFLEAAAFEGPVDAPTGLTRFQQYTYPPSAANPPECRSKGGLCKSFASITCNTKAVPPPSGMLPHPLSSPLPPSPQPPLDSALPPGDLCILYNSRKVPYRLEVGMRLCECASLCKVDDTCAERKFCPSSIKRWECEQKAPEPHSSETPCLPPPSIDSLERTPDGTCWVLVLSYQRKNTTFPLLTARSFAHGFPKVSKSVLGSDGSLDAPSWGHMTGEALRALGDPRPLRFWAESSCHDRRIHFRTNFTLLWEYVTDKFIGPVYYPNDGSWYTLESDHSAIGIPQAAASSLTYDLTPSRSALTDHTFFQPFATHWNIRSSAARAFRFEVDDAFVDYASESTACSTHHRVWIMSDACPPAPPPSPPMPPPPPQVAIPHDYIAHEKLDFLSNTLSEPSFRFGGTNTARTFEDCKAACDSNPRCESFTFGDHPNGCPNCCWTRGAPTFNPVEATWAISYRKAGIKGEGGPKYTIRIDTDFDCNELSRPAAFYIGTNRARTFRSCKLTCDADPGCKAFLFSSAEHVNCPYCCWTKWAFRSGPPCNPTLAHGITSYFKDPNAGPPCDLTEGQVVKCNALVGVFRENEVRLFDSVQAYVSAGAPPIELQEATPCPRIAACKRGSYVL